MTSFTRRNAAIAIFIVAFTTTAFTLFVYNWTLLGSQDQKPLSSKWKCINESWCVTISGNVNESVQIGISKLRDNSTFVYVPNRPYAWLNVEGSSDTMYFAGVELADVLVKTKVILPNATKLQFEGTDGYVSFELPISVVLANPDEVLLANSENNNTLATKDQGGDGPIKSFVALDVLQGNAEVTAIFHANGKTFVYNSGYAVKWCNYIKII